MNESLRSGLLLEDDSGALQFRHALARQAIYESISPSSLKQLHRRAATSIESDAPVRRYGELAHHYRKAEAWPRSAHFAELAGDHARDHFDPEGAAAHLQEALSTPGLDITVRVRLALKLGRVAQCCIDVARAIDLLSELLDEMGPAEEGYGEVRLRRAQLLMLHRGQEEANYRELAECVPAVMGDPDLAASAMGFLGSPWGLPGDVDEHHFWLDAMAKVIPSLSDPVGRRDKTWDHLTFRLYLGDPRGWDLFEDARKNDLHKDGQRVVRVLSNMATACVHLGCFGRARRFLEEARTHADDIHQPWLESALGANELQTDWAMGEWAGLRPGEQRYLSAMRAMDAGCSGRGLVVGLSTLVHNDSVEAERLLEGTLKRASESGAIPMQLAARAALARLALSKEDLALATEHARQGMQVVTQKKIWAWAGPIAPTAVWVMLQIGAADEAIRFTRAMEAGLEDKDSPGAEAALHSCLGSIEAAGGEVERARSELDRALSLWRALPNPYEAALLCERRALLEIDDGPKIAALLTDALEGFGELGAVWDLARVRREMRARKISIPYPYRGGRRRYGDELSPRELEIATLAALGKTNKEIARETFISPRTVESHLASAMRKVGVGDRKALATFPWHEKGRVVGASSRVKNQ